MRLRIGTIIITIFILSGAVFAENYCFEEIDSLLNIGDIIKITNIDTQQYEGKLKKYNQDSISIRITTEGFYKSSAFYKFSLSDIEKIEYDGKQNQYKPNQGAYIGGGMVIGMAAALALSQKKQSNPYWIKSNFTTNFVLFTAGGTLVGYLLYKLVDISPRKIPLDITINCNSTSDF